RSGALLLACAWRSGRSATAAGEPGKNASAARPVKPVSAPAVCQSAGRQADQRTARLADGLRRRRARRLRLCVRLRQSGRPPVACRLWPALLPGRGRYHAASAPTARKLNPITRKVLRRPNKAANAALTSGARAREAAARELSRP